MSVRQKLIPKVHQILDNGYEKDIFYDLNVKDMIEFIRDIETYEPSHHSRFDYYMYQHVQDVLEELPEWVQSLSPAEMNVFHQAFNHALSSTIMDRALHQWRRHLGPIFERFLLEEEADVLPLRRNIWKHITDSMSTEDVEEFRIVALAFKPQRDGFFDMEMYAAIQDILCSDATFRENCLWMAFLHEFDRALTDEFKTNISYILDTDREETPMFIKAVHEYIPRPYGEFSLDTFVYIGSRLPIQDAVIWRNSCFSFVAEDAFELAKEAMNRFKTQKTIYEITPAELNTLAELYRLYNASVCVQSHSASRAMRLVNHPRFYEKHFVQQLFSWLDEIETLYEEHDRYEIVDMRERTNVIISLCWYFIDSSQTLFDKLMARGGNVLFTYAVFLNYIFYLPELKITPHDSQQLTILTTGCTHGFLHHYFRPGDISMIRLKLLYLNHDVTPRGMVSLIALLYKVDSAEARLIREHLIRIINKQPVWKPSDVKILIELILKNDVVIPTISEMVSKDVVKAIFEKVVTEDNEEVAVQTIIEAYNGVYNILSITPVEKYHPVQYERLLETIIEAETKIESRFGGPRIRTRQPAVYKQLYHVYHIQSAFRFHHTFLKTHSLYKSEELFL